MANDWCIQAKMGNTHNYLAKCSVGQLIDSWYRVKELPNGYDMTTGGWKDAAWIWYQGWSEEMVPYVVDDPNRFFGSLIIGYIFRSRRRRIWISWKTIPSVNGMQATEFRWRIWISDINGKVMIDSSDGQHRLSRLRLVIMVGVGDEFGRRKCLQQWTKPLRVSLIRFG